MKKTYFTKVIAFVNQKGGVGKTTSAANFAWGLAKKGYEVLAIDLDQQGHLSKSMGANENGNTAFEWLKNDLPLDIVVQQVSGGVKLIPANISLASWELELQKMFIDREYVLHNAIKKAAMYDYIIIDSPPSFGNISINILTAADAVIIPFRPDYLSKDGVLKLLDTISLVQKRLNPKLKIAGYLPTMVDKRCNNQASFDETQNLALKFGGKLFGEGIRLASVLTKIPEQGISIYDYDCRSAAAEDYTNFVEMFLEGKL